MEARRQAIMQNALFYPTLQSDQRHMNGTVEVGMTWPSRKALCVAGVHAKLVAGIDRGRHGEGAVSVVLSGGYEDDRDSGEIVLYTGAGGREQNPNGSYRRNARQASEQTFYHKDNRALQISQETGDPIKLIRGIYYRGEQGRSMIYRYDGLYKVVEAKLTVGKSKHTICQFRFEREPNQPPLPRN